LFSALRRMGLEDAAQVLGEWLHYPPTTVEDVNTPDELAIAATDITPIA
jgi:hypothetical protein